MNIEQELLEKAKQAARHSHATQSDFSVGAALLIEDINGQQQIVTGANYETGNYTSTCAEMNVLNNSMVEHGPKTRLLKIVVYSPNSDKVLTPCGTCRQYLYEAEPDLEVVCYDNKGNSKTYLAKELLPDAFDPTTPQSETKPKLLDKLAPYIAHFPIMLDRLEFLANADRMIIVGSPIRAKKLAEKLGDAREYCHIASGNTDREYSVFALPEHNMLIASHGIGASGIEICLSEIGALIALAKGDDSQVTPLKYIIRSGTRGTIVDLPLGALAISELTVNDWGEESRPDPELFQAILSTAKEQQIDITSVKSLCAQFFLSTQGRYAYPFRDKGESDQEYLRDLQDKGFQTIEMEDYYIHDIGQKYGIKTACVGLVIASRYNVERGVFQLSYDLDIKKERELLPALLAFEVLKAL